MITKAAIKASFPNAVRIERVKSKQLFIATYPDCSLLISYTTIVGYKDKLWHTTDRQYSKTTSRQLTYFRNYVDFSTVESDEEIQNFVNGVQL